MLLVQTLYFANQQKTEATITELLVGLHYMWKFRYHVLSIPKQLLSPQISGLQKDQDPDGESNTAAVDAKQVATSIVNLLIYVEEMKFGDISICQKNITKTYFYIQICLQDYMQ